MCGLVAVITKNRNGFTHPQREVFSSLLFIDFLRGPDSTGAFVINNKGDVMGGKEASDSLRFIQTKEYNDMHTKVWSDGAAMVGHNRKATRGSVNDDNAHPFIVDNNIVLVHNGTLFGDHKKLADVEVDSHAIAHMIHEKGNVTEALSSIDGAYALIWYDVSAGKLCLIRNTQRPLWWMETDDAWIWSSEEAMLKFVADRHTLSVKAGPIELPENVLQTYSLENGTWAVDDEKLAIKKPAYQAPAKYEPPNTYERMQQSYNRRHMGHPYANAYEQQWGDDAPFASLPVLPPEPTTKFVATMDSPGSLGHFERNMAKKTNRVVTQEEYHSEILRSYPVGKDIICETFEYAFVNMLDDREGFYLYSTVVDDPDVIFRMRFLKKYADEARMIAIAGGAYIYKFKVGRKRWAPFAPGNVVERSPGFVIIDADKATLLDGGGVKSSSEGATIQ